MSDAFEYDPDTKKGALDRANCRCLGARPWLGEYQLGQMAAEIRRTVQGDDGIVRDEKVTSCGLGLRVVQRGASNVYFPQVVSSIYLPFWEENKSRLVIKALEDPQVWNFLHSGLESGRISRMRCGMIVELFGNRYPVPADELLTAAQAKLDGQPVAEIIRHQTEEEYRRGEYEALCQARGDENHELLVKAADLGDYQEWIARYFTRICLVHKLRETRALTGFTRLLPPDGGQGSARLQSIRVGSRCNWLPAIVVRGEGLFFEVNLDEVQLWINRYPAIVTRRIAPLNESYQATRQRRDQQPRLIGPKFVLLHTLAHLLINRLAFDCGYGSASLRERLYCDFTPGSEPMQGILIYTASGDAEGTMGGLVRQGRPGRLEQTILEGLHAAAWCSSDPVCIESQGQGADNANLAACHGCSLVPETSCEEGNRLLDRAMLIGTPDGLVNGYFADLV